jgi:hypothetical protein
LTAPKTGGKPSSFSYNAKLWGIFDEDIVKNTFCKKSKDNVERLFSIEEIAQ